MKASTQLNSEHILHRDDDLLCLNKPAGIPMHASRILADEPETLLMMAKSLTGRGQLLVHRLDRPVSGVVVMAGNRSSQTELGRQFENRLVEKRYLAVVRGWTEPQGRISHPLLPPKDDRKAGSVAREAITSFERIARTELPHPVPPYASSRYSLLALYPHTGRRHQLRRHAKHMNHPIIGDTTYGRGEHNRLFRREFDCRRLLLHAWSIRLSHPISGERLTVHGPLDGSFSRVVSELGWTGDLERWHARATDER